MELMASTSEQLDWQARGLCADPSVSLKTKDSVFFPDSETPARARVAEARYCGHCPVRAACLTYAVTSAPYGLWAGTTPEQRRALGRKRARVKCPTCQAFDPMEIVGVAEGVMVVTQFCRSCAASWISATLAVKVVVDEMERIQGDERSQPLKPACPDTVS